jgi:hypothetical protein
MCVYHVGDIVKVHIEFSVLTVADHHLRANGVHAHRPRTRAYLDMLYTITPATRPLYVRSGHHTRHTQPRQLRFGQAAIATQIQVWRDFANRTE